MVSSVNDYLSNVFQNLPSVITDFAIQRQGNESMQSGNVTVGDSVASGKDFRLMQPIWDLCLGREEYEETSLFYIVLTLSF